MNKLKTWLKNLFIDRTKLGVKDINGKDIRVNDIIKAKLYPFYGDAPTMENGRENPIELNYVGVVGFDLDGAYYELHRVSTRVRGSAIGGDLSEILEYVEVIGDVRKNPEMLEVNDGH